MPSDPRVSQALLALAQPIAEFRALALGALAQSEAHLTALAAEIGRASCRERVFKDV